MSHSRILKRVVKPRENLINYFTNTNFTKILTEHNELVAKMINNPFRFYQTYNSKLRHDSNIEFPELKGPMYYLIQKLYQDSSIVQLRKTDKTFDIMMKQTEQNIISVTCENGLNLPYKYTILVIEEMLKTLDCYYRTQNDYADYYHNFRYRMYLTYLLEQSGKSGFIFPSSYNFSLTDLIKLRCVPIWILGITNKPLYIDQYTNTPLDFWAHDIQHNRRTLQETERYYDVFVKHKKYNSERSPFSIVTKDEFYKYMCELTFTKIIPIITPNENDSDEEIGIKSMCKLIIFEIVHEKAWPITIFSIIRNIKLGYDVYPIESLSIDKNIKITYDAFNDPTALANVHYKLLSGFYDDITINSNLQSDFIIDSKYRNSKYILEASRRIISIFS